LIAIDASSLRRFLRGEPGWDVDLTRSAIISGEAILPPPVLTELLSYPEEDPFFDDIRAMPTLNERAGFWDRAGLTRRAALLRGRKAHFADSLIAQFCINTGVPLIAHDPDFRAFIFAGLELLR
jgi:predicted nucleic acid-binding protein